MAKMDNRWRGWIQENLKRNVDMQDILRILLEKQFAVHEIKKEMGDHFPSYSLLLGPRPQPDYNTVNNVPLTKLGEALGVKRVDSPKIQIYTIESFMTAEECEQLMAVMNQHLRPSTVVAKVDDPYYRTS